VRDQLRAHRQHERAGGGDSGEMTKREHDGGLPENGVGRSHYRGYPALY
jgi:hypothetical protein